MNKNNILSKLIEISEQNQFKINFSNFPKYISILSSDINYNPQNTTQDK